MQCVLRRSQLLRFEARTLREKLLLERERKAAQVVVQRPYIELGGEAPEVSDLTDDDLAFRAGLIQDSKSVADLALQREQMERYVSEQKNRSAASRNAFFEWQAGQREKGAARRIHRQVISSERFKRLRASSAGKRLLSVAYYSDGGDNTNNDENPISRGSLERHRK